MHNNWHVLLRSTYRYRFFVQLFCNFLFSEARGGTPKTIDFIGISGTRTDVLVPYGPEGQGFESLRVRHTVRKLRKFSELPAGAGHRCSGANSVSRLVRIL